MIFLGRSIKATILSSLGFSSVVPFTVLKNQIEKNNRNLNTIVLRKDIKVSQYWMEIEKDWECKKVEVKGIDLKQVPLNESLTTLYCYKNGEYSWKIWIPSELLKEEGTDIKDRFRLATFKSLQEQYKVQIYSDSKVLITELILKDPKFYLSQQDWPEDIKANEEFWNLFEYEVLQISTLTKLSELIEQLKVWVVI